MPALPNFLIVGAQKAGTTWLTARLREHSEVFMRKGEVHFFNVDDSYRKGLNWYADQFHDWNGQRVIGEKTPDYLWINRPNGEGGHIPERIHQSIPDTKIIIILRNPVSRAISALNHQIVARRLSPFIKADDILLGKDIEQGQRFGMIERGYYVDQIPRYKQLFDKVLVLLFEDDIVKNPQESLETIRNFLELENAFEEPKIERRENSGMHSKVGQVLNYYAPLISPIVSGLDRLLPKSEPCTPSQNTLNNLYKIYSEPNRRLEEVLGRSLTSWSSNG
jgi:sulfotransferase family protein